MKMGFYPTLASSGMYKNKKLYLPYLLTCIGMAMMYYIICFLCKSKGVAAMRGGSEMQMVLSFGCGVIAVFAVILLFYTNSFLIRRRKKEFGLYNILGMGKKNLFRVLFWETLFCAGITLIGGLVCGILFSKVAELCMAKILATSGSMTFSIEWGAVFQTVILFGVIFVLLLVNSVRQIYVAKPVELMKSEAAGEKPPKANWVCALLGVLLLGGAYYLAVTIEDPIATMLWFFVAVIMVIIGTYLLFIAGSVVLCRLLQKNKKYYYKTNHFVSVSTMVYRMKRNGAGLASICILSTMVLVMISSTAGLFIGKEGSLRNRYPRNVVLDTQSIEESYTEQIHQIAKQAVDSHGLLQQDLMNYQYLAVAGYQLEDQIIFDQSKLTSFDMTSYSDVKQLFIIPISDYNRLMGTKEVLEDNEILLYSTKTEYPYDTIALEGCEPMKIKKEVPDFVKNGVDTSQVVSSLFLFVSGMEQMEQIFKAQSEIYGENASFLHDWYGFDLSCKEEEMTALTEEIAAQIRQLQLEDGSFPRVNTECVAKERWSFYALYGGMFFLGGLLGLVFVLGAVLIIYYKQISEGYEDQARFVIMQKVGMTKKEIRKSINSQVLTVFFLPLIAAGVHTGFAFPMFQKILLMFGLADIPLLIGVAVGCYLLFGVFYVLVYRATSRAYYGICTNG